MCDHYQRKCLLVAPCCNKEYECRVCHDDNENHVLNRKEVEHVVCTQCKKNQKVVRNCEECGILFGNYSCLICRLFDDVDKQQFHCEGCGICRVGGEENFFHCNVCNMCIMKTIRETHKCLVDSSKKNCPVCLEYLHTSRKILHVPSCSHLMHWECYRDMLKHGKYTCPLCYKSLEDMSTYWSLLDKEINETPMPPEYQNYKVNVLCRDCGEESSTLFHVVGLKCSKCAGYNTTRVGGDEPLPSDPLNTLQNLVQTLNEQQQDEDEDEGSDIEDDDWQTVSEGESPDSDSLDPEAPKDEGASLTTAENDDDSPASGTTETNI